MCAHLCNGSLIVSQPQEKDPGFIDFNGNSATPPLHLTHGGCLFRSRLSDQSLEKEREVSDMEYDLIQLFR